MTSGRDRLSGTSARRFGPWRAIAAVWGRLEEGVGLERGEGGRALIDRAQDLVDTPQNHRRVTEALIMAFDAKQQKMETKPVDLFAVEVDARDHPQFTIETHVPALVAEVERLREALAPFAAIAKHFEDVGRDDGIRPGVADCKRAREVLP